MDHETINIAVIISGIDEEYQSSILKGIHAFAEHKPINICHFIAFGGVLANQKHDIGEYNIYNLVNYKKLDGVILMNNTICSTEMKERILSQVRQVQIPVVSVDQELDDFFHVGIDNYAAMRELVEHIVLHHGARTINYVSGPKNNPESILRLQAFCDVLRENRIELEDERIFYGEFRRNDGRAATEYFLRSKLSMPQAIICANDVMAISTLIALENHGIHAPHDILVSGFDNIHAGRNYAPELTSVARPLFESGYTACEMIYNAIFNQPQKRSKVLSTRLIAAESCGCHNEQSDSVETFKKENYRTVESSSIDVQRNNRMVCSLTECESYEQMIERLKDFVLEIRCDAFYLCLCEGWCSNYVQGINNVHDIIVDNYTVAGYTQQMTVPLAYFNGEFREYNDFPSELMLPDLFNADDDGKQYYFSPIHFRERCLGYCVICNSRFPLESQSYAPWIMNISNSLENIRKMICMDAVVQELDRLYIIDPLSGIYNRNGFTRNTRELYENCMQEQCAAMVMFLDLDGLKYINDNFGHKEGDRAISAIGNILKEVCADGEICSRFGGDEFLIFAIHYTDEKAQRLMHRIEAACDEYNQNADVNFTLACSLGYCLQIPDFNLPLFSMISVADQKMYEQKRKKKTSKYLRK